MSYGRKLISVFTMAFALVAFSTVAAAQDTPPTDQPKKVDRDGKKRHHMRGKRGKRGMRGQRGKRGGRGMRGRRGARRGGFGRTIRSLNLSDAQKTQLQSLMKSQREAGAASRKEARELMMARRSGLLTEAQKARMTALREQRKANRAKFQESFVGILNAEQKAKYQAQMDARKKRMEAMKKRMQERKKRMQERRKKMHERRKMRKESSKKENG